jgi:hypothetical protein
MTLTLPDDTKHCRIVNQPCGSRSRLHVYHYPSNWVLYTTGHGPDLVADVEMLRRRLEKGGYTVEPGYEIEDANAKIRRMMWS